MDSQSVTENPVHQISWSTYQKNGIPVDLMKTTKSWFQGVELANEHVLLSIWSRPSKTAKNIKIEKKNFADNYNIFPIYI